MSRHIQTTNPENRKLNNNTQNGKLILTYLDGINWLFLLQNDVLVSAQIIQQNNPDKIGEIYIGKVKNVLPNIQAYFVEIEDGQICYLSFKDAEAAIVLNRKITLANSSSESKEPIRLVQGDELLVQVIRNPIKTKPAAVSANLELSSDYFIIKAGDSGLGISNKIGKSKSKAIRNLLMKEEFNDYAVIVRTACEQLEDNEIKERFKQQLEDFKDIYRKAAHRTCFSCILKNESPVIPAIKRMKDYEYDEIITDDPEYYKLICEKLKDKKVRLYTDSAFPLSKLYGLTTKLDNALAKKVWLKSGAYLIIEQTECLTAIDVNTGKNIHGKASDDVIFHVNMEAAKEATLQIRLRNLSGIIIIDFINMKDPAKNEELLAYLASLTAKDPIPTNVIDMTPLGLVEVTRKKSDMSLQEQYNNINHKTKTGV